MRNARQPVRNLRPAAKNLVAATPRLTTLGEKLNKLFNMAAYNPNGAEAPGTAGRDEGYLYWLGWLGHVGNSTFQAQDATGFTATSTWWRPATRSSRSSPPARSLPRSPDSDSCSGRCARHEPDERRHGVMQKQAPSIGRILVAVGFTLSCFALLLFLWVTFGGPIPFKPESYRFTADFPEAITLQKEADVRIGGVSVGKVKDLSLAPDSECQKDPTTCNKQYIGFAWHPFSYGTCSLPPSTWPWSRSSDSIGSEPT